MRRRILRKRSHFCGESSKSRRRIWERTIRNQSSFWSSTQTPCRSLAEPQKLTKCTLGQSSSEPRGRPVTERCRTDRLEHQFAARKRGRDERLPCSLFKTQK